MKLITTFVCFILLAFPVWVKGQSEYIPKNLGNAINSEYDEINPVLSPDGKTLFFVRVNHPENYYGSFDSEDIWYSEWANGAWRTAEHLPQLNTGRYNAILSISSDGKSVLINGVFNKKGTFFLKRGLSISTRTANGWGTPQRLRIKKMRRFNSGANSNAFLSNDENYIVVAMSKRYASEKTNLYVIRKINDHKWAWPMKLKAINSSQNDEAPFLSADNKTLYFASDRKQKGQFDIYKTQLLSTDWKRWTEPKPLNDTINSVEWESYFKTNRKGSYAYFSSTNNSIGNADIFKVKLFEENPFVVISGIVKNKKTQLPISKIVNYKILSDGKPIDSIKTNSDSSSFKIKLPLGKKYQLIASAEKYTSSPETIDVSTLREFTKLKRDLQLTPFPYVLLKGSLYLKDTKDPIPAEASPSLWINDTRIDSAKIDLTKGTYELKINHGQSYQLQVRATKHDPVPATLDLTKVGEYQEISLDLFAEPEKMVSVVGKILDKKTNKPFPPGSKLKIVVDGMPHIIVTVDTLTSDYQLKLPPGANYTISASSLNYYPVYEPISLTNAKGNERIFKDLYIVPIEVGQSIRLNNIFFESGKAVLKPESFVELDKVANFLKDNPDIRIEIGGHTDNVGNATLNQQLSLARAKSVMKYILSQGVAEDRIVAKGYGLTKPVTSNATKEGQSKNRRVEFTVLEK
ncbi:MAG: OmpA family protein [Bacteroidetes bacterium]|nr:OmpA family protein [Bacteroidota bacterium]